MNADIKAKWLEALRSGKYEQGMHFLQSNKQFCCLGVLCDVLNVNAVLNTATGIVDYEGQKSYLPDRIEKLAELDLDLCRRLADLNDDGRSFEEIANWIEAHL